MILENLVSIFKGKRWIKTGDYSCPPLYLCMCRIYSKYWFKTNFCSLKINWILITIWSVIWDATKTGCVLRICYLHKRNFIFVDSCGPIAGFMNYLFSIFGVNVTSHVNSYHWFSLQWIWPNVTPSHNAGYQKKDEKDSQFLTFFKSFGSNWRGNCSYQVHKNACVCYRNRGVKEERMF